MYCLCYHCAYNTHTHKKTLCNVSYHETAWKLLLNIAGAIEWKTSRNKINKRNPLTLFLRNVYFRKRVVLKSRVSNHQNYYFIRLMVSFFRNLFGLNNCLKPFLCFFFFFNVSRNLHKLFWRRELTFLRPFTFKLHTRSLYTYIHG